jgi:hypothetical protein
METVYEQRTPDVSVNITAVFENSIRKMSDTLKMPAGLPLGLPALCGICKQNGNCDKGQSKQRSYLLSGHDAVLS